MKNGLVWEQEELVYYRHDKPYHAGVVKENGAIYYIGKGGRAVKGQHIVHGEMANGILKRGTYDFGDDYQLIKGSYRAPRVSKRRRSHSKHKKFSQKQKALLGVCGVLLALLLTVGIIYQVFDYAGSDDSQTTPHTMKAVLPTFDEPVALCSPLALQVYRGECVLTTEAAKDTPYRAFVFKYQLFGDDGMLYLSEHADMSDAREWILAVSETSVVIDNLMTGKTYYYKVIADGEETVGHFETAASTRFVFIDGALNTRDIGGYVTMDGKTVKQGLLIRGTEIDGLVEASYFVKDEDIQAAQAQFGFVYDMDLRSNDVYSGSYTSPFGVKHRFYGSPAYGSIFNSIYQPAVKQIFSDLAKKEHYPMYMHCTYGADRTGTIVFLLQGVLGMSEEEMLKEYRRTAWLSGGYATSNSMETVIDGLQPYAGDTLNEKIETFLIQEIGVTAEELAAIREIFLED